jgi:putrescine transport system substrate-binding protein
MRRGVQELFTLIRDLQLAAGIAALLALGACGGHRAPGPPDSKDASAKILNIDSWADYIAPDTVANFEKETGIKVRYDTYESNEVLETKLLTGHTNYDVVLPTDTFFERLMRAGTFRKLDKAALTNYANLDPEILQKLAVHDPGNLYATPYLWTSVGIGYNVAKVQQRLGSAPLDSWSVILDPKNAAKLQDCGITVVDAPLDVISSTLVYLGKDPNTRDPADVAAAEQVLMKIRPYVRSIEAQAYIGELANGSLCAALGWSGDIVQARSRAEEAGGNVKINYFVPREGSLIIVDMMAIPADAPHPKEAMLWLNYLMRPDVMAGITNAVKYPNGNRAAMMLVKESLRQDPVINPDPSVRARLHSLVMAPPDFIRLLTRVWTRFRTGE